MATCANDAFEAATWTCQRTMARDLLRRHRDISTVRAMVANHFGYAPSVAALTRMRKSLPRQLVPGGNLTPMLGDVESHPRAMVTGSQMLVEAISKAHPGRVTS